MAAGTRGGQENGGGGAAAGRGSEGREAQAARSFGAALRALRLQRAMNQATLAGRAGLDRSYINRLEAGERGAPARSAVEGLASALGCSGEETDRLLAAAELLPQPLLALGPADRTLLLLARRLLDPALSPQARAALRLTVEQLLQHWGEPAASNTPAAYGAADEA